MDADISQICPWLYISGAPSAADLVQLAADGVLLDIDMAADVNDQTPPGMDYVHVAWADDGQPKPVHDFAYALDCVADLFHAVPPMGRVLLHCAAGVNRAPTMATFLLAAFSGVDGATAFARVKAARPVANGYLVAAYAQSVDAALAALRGSNP